MAAPKALLLATAVLALIAPACLPASATERADVDPNSIVIPGPPLEYGRYLSGMSYTGYSQGNSVPPPVTPEFPFALALPAAFAAGVSAWWLLRRRRLRLTS